jgi:hypothetical protein
MGPLHGDPRYQRLVAQGKKDLTLALGLLQAALDRGELPPSFDGTLAELRGLQNRTP